MDAAIWQEIEHFISNNAFPILCVIFMWRKITASDEANRELLAELKGTISELTHYIKEHGGKDGT